MADVTHAEPRTRSCVWIWWAVGVVAALVALGVFALPWLVPVTIKPIVSESQALGFNNRVAIVSLLLGCLAVGILAQVWRFRCVARNAGSAADHGVSLPAPVVGLDAAPAAERLSRSLVVGLVAAVMVMVGLTAYIYRSYPVADSAYFVDRLLYLLNGSRLYVDFEFAYGPLLLYPQYLMALVLRALGLSVYPAHYAFVAVLQSCGVALLAYLLNRLTMPKAMRTLLFSASAAVLLLGMSAIGPNYSFVRFLVPFAAVVWALGAARKGAAWTLVAPVAATVFAYLISPEMGIVTMASLAVALGFSATKELKVRWLAAAVTVAVGAVGWWAYGSMPGSALAGFAGGNANVPFLPGLQAIVFLASVLVATWGVGATTDLRERASSAAQSGWFTAGIALTISAMGRADWIHLFYNGLGMILLASALAWALWRSRSYAYVAVYVASFAIAATTFFLLIGVAHWFVAGANSGALTQAAARGIAHRVGRKYSDGTVWWSKARVREPLEADVVALSKQGGVFSASWLQGRFGKRLANAGALVPVFDPPHTTGNQAQADKLLSDLDAARVVLIRKVEFDEYQLLLRTAVKKDWADVHSTRTPSSPKGFGVASAFPLSVQPANPTLDPLLVFARALAKDWTVDHRSGDYYILRRR